jgi:hypothetical protein
MGASARGSSPYLFTLRRPKAALVLTNMNTCLVLGAGASRANAIYFHPKRMRDTWPPLDATFFETMAARKMPLPASLSRYLERFLGFTPTVEDLLDRRMEEVFKDVFYDFLETPSDRVAYNAYIELVELYLDVLRGTTNWLARRGRRGAPVGRLLAALAPMSERLSVITFNHDLVIENEIYKRAALRNRWCLDQGYGSMSADLNLLIPTGSKAVFPIHNDGGCDHTRPITLLKLHGSLNWSVRLTSANPTSNYLSGRAGPRRTYLYIARQITSRTQIVRTGVGRTSWETWPVVVPPVYAKQALRSAVVEAWSDARTALESAERVIFFGYSLPLIDVEAEKLFERGLAANDQVRWVDVVNPGPESAARYAGLAPATPVRWFSSPEEFFSAEGLT